MYFVIDEYNLFYSLIAWIHILNGATFHGISAIVINVRVFQQNTVYATFILPIKLTNFSWIVWTIKMGRKKHSNTLKSTANGLNLAPLYTCYRLGVANVINPAFHSTFNPRNHSIFIYHAPHYLAIKLIKAVVSINNQQHLLFAFFCGCTFSLTCHIKLMWKCQ